MKPEHAYLLFLIMVAFFLMLWIYTNSETIHAEPLKPSDYEIGLLQESAYIMGWEAGNKEAHQQQFNEYAAIAQEIHGFGYRPELLPPPVKPERGT